MVARKESTSVSQTEKPRKLGRYSKRIISIVAFLIGFFIVGYILSSYNQGYISSPYKVSAPYNVTSTYPYNYSAGVHITMLTYHYYNPKTGEVWTYSLTRSFDIGTNATINMSIPFTSNLTCSMTISDVYATTPGFTVFIHPPTVTFQPGQPSSFNFTIISPPYSYSGPLDINITVVYGSGC
ncbi:MAG: hypothetical protein QXP36_06720 [Conexivisphaerales archaeon]